MTIKRNPMKRIIFPGLTFIFILLAACSSNKSVVPARGSESVNVLNEAPVSAGTGYFYSLPSTAVVVEVEVKKTTFIPGPYARHAGRLLGLNDVINRYSERYDITDIAMSSFAEPDPDHMYYITLPDEAALNRYLSLSESGLLAGIGREVFEKRPEVNIPESKDYGLHSTDATFNYFLDINLMERIDTIVEQVREDTITLRRQTLRRSWVEKNTDQRAREVADYILELREKKFDLISGFQEISYSKEALEYMYSEMNKLESDYLDLFTGLTTDQTYKYRFIHKPSKEDANSRHVLFSFSNIYGILDAIDEDGRPFILTYERSKLTDPLEDRFNHRATQDDQTAFGVHYRIPEYADIKIFLDNKKRAEARMLISQFGVVSHLPSEDLEIRMHPGSGSIKSIGVPESKQIPE
jgi:hypothetical protein